MNFYPDPYMMEELAFAVMGILTSGVPSMLLAIASYVLTSMALYTLASRRGISHAWFSWVPVLNVWIIGSLSDQYRYVVKGQYKSKRKTLLILNLLQFVIGAVIAGICIFMVTDLISESIYGVIGSNVMRSIMGPGLAAGGFGLLLAGISIAAAVVYYMALYDIYTSMDPANNVLFLVLSIIFNVTEPFFLFFSRNKDEGMPHRREEPCWKPQEPVYEAWEDNENNKDYL